VGSTQKIRAAAEEAGADISGIEIIDIPDHRAAALRSVALVHEGRAKVVMKGHLHTDQLLHAILKKEGGLRTNRRLSHVFVMDVPGLDHLLFVTDAAINIAPDLECKVSIVQNAIDLAISLGIETPKVGILSAVETVTPSIPSTIDAAVLSKMADRGQITGGLVDGPLAMDNAVDLGAARTKGLTGLVAGRAEILVAPNMEAGNMIAKELTFLAHAEAGGVVMGAQVPVILTSRADDDQARLASCAVAALNAAIRGRARERRADPDAERRVLLDQVRPLRHRARPEEHLRGQIDRLGPRGAAGARWRRATRSPPRTTPPGLAAILEALAPRIGGGRIAGIGHRVVHGGPDIDAPQRPHARPDRTARRARPLAPLHQPHNLAGVRAAIAAFPDAVQVACFDTAFHRGHPGSTTPSPCRAASTTRACGATASTG
jgi:predicted methyltransferase MtxX (methanogen marker protein 4)